MEATISNDFEYEVPEQATFTPEAQAVVDWQNNHVVKCSHLELRTHHSQWHEPDLEITDPEEYKYFYCKCLCGICNYKHCPTR